MSLRFLAFLIFGLLVLGIIQHDRALRTTTKHQPKSVHPHLFSLSNSPLIQQLGPIIPQALYEM